MILILYGIRHEIMLFLNKSDKPLFIREISLGTGRTYGMIGQKTKELEEKGLVCYKSNPNDIKKRMVTLTPKGAEVVKILHKLKPLLSLENSSRNLSY